jgi:hypothetical protein
VGVGKVAAAALRQELVPLDLAGRVSSVVRSSVVGAASIAALTGGGLVVLLGAHAPFAIGGTAQMVAAIAIGGSLARRLAAAEREVIDLRDAVDLIEAPAAVDVA